MEAAKKRFLHYGYKKTTIDEIALDAEISRATLYCYFKNKEDVIIQLIDQEALDLQRALYEKIKHLKDPLKIMELTFSVALEYLDENPFLRRILKRDPEIVSPRLMRYVFEIEDRYTTILEEFARQALGKSSRTSFDPRMVAYVFYKIFEAFSYGSTLNENIEVSNEEIIKFVRKLIRNALGAS